MVIGMVVALWGALRGEEGCFTYLLGRLGEGGQIEKGRNLVLEIDGFVIANFD